jgi:glycosyltransferase involved in cell wall biosynthesis
MIILHQRIIPKYRIPVFERIINSSNEVSIFYGNEHKSETLKNGKTRSNKFVLTKNIYLTKRADLFINFGLIQYIIKKKPRVIITQFGVSNLAVYILFILRPFIKFKLILWGHGWNRKKNNLHSINFKFRLFILNNSDAVMVYSKEAKTVLKKFIKADKIFVVNNTLDTEILINTRNELKLHGSKIKNSLENFSQYNLIFVARIEPYKNPNRVINVFKHIHLVLPSTSLHFIGSGSLKEHVMKFAQESNISNVYFYDAVYDNLVVGKYIYCSDLMIIPRGLGLSLIHSFCFNCPVAVFEDRDHGPEISYLKHNINGFKLYGLSDEEISNLIIQYLKTPSLKSKFVKEIHNTLSFEASIELMIENFFKCVKYTLNNDNI